MEAREAERLRALEACEQMRLRYAQLDVFKLDVIARELKKVDQAVDVLRREAKEVADATRGRCHSSEADRERLANEAFKMVQNCADLRAHMRDIIEKCLSETQKLHIGSAVVDGLAAGELTDGGVMSGWVRSPNVNASQSPEPTAPPHGASRAARLRQSDEMRREVRRAGSPAAAPGAASPP